VTFIFTTFLAFFVFLTIYLITWPWYFLPKYGVVKKYYQFAEIIDDVLLSVFAVLFT
jgi:hypothetical protein